MQPAFHVGELVRPKLPARTKAEGHAYCIVRILRVESGAPAYLIKNMRGAERVVEQQDIETASEKALP